MARSDDRSPMTRLMRALGRRRPDASAPQPAAPQDDATTAALLVEAFKHEARALVAQTEAAAHQHGNDARRLFEIVAERREARKAAKAIEQKVLDAGGYWDPQDRGPL